MKKSLSLILAIVLVLSSLACMTVVGGAAEAETTPSQEIAFYNISLKANTCLLFAVPADGYAVKADGTVDNLQLLVWEGDSASGLYNKKDATAKGEVVEASGKTTIGEKEYVVFSYSGLSASQMTETVYVRTLYTNARGDRSYGEVYDYSVAEFAMTYNGSKADLVNKMLAYGDACEAHFSAGKPAQSYKASEAKSLVPITVTTKIGNTVLSTQVTQLAKVGDIISLKAPHVDGATLKSWNVADPDNVTVAASGNEFVATYDEKVLINYNYDNTAKSTVGSYISSLNAANTGSTGTKSGLIDGSYNVGNNLLSTNTGKLAYTYSKFEVVDDNGNQCIKYSHTSAGQATGASLAQKGVGDSVSALTYSISLKAYSDTMFSPTAFRIGRAGPGNTSTDRGGDVTLFQLDKKGNVKLTGTAADGYTALITTLTKDAFRDITVVVNFPENRMYGYCDGSLTAVTTLPSSLKPASYVGGADGNNTEFTSNIYGGYQSGEWTAEEIAKAKEATVMLGDVETKVFENDTWNHAALEVYVCENSSFYFDNWSIALGDTTR